MKTFMKIPNMIIVTALLLALFGVQPAYAASYIVDTTSDSNLTACTSAANDCSLRGAINDANLAGGTNTITFQAGLTGTITLTSALPTITNNLSITGNGTANTIIDGANSFQVFNMGSGVTVSLSEMAIQNGRATNGGGINNNGTLTVTNSILSGNLATSGNGGGIYNNGTATVTGSTISGNLATSRGGGIYNSGVAVTVTDSTVSGNRAVFGSGIFNDGTATVTNSTLSGNSTLFGGSGGGINNNGTLTVTNSTLSGNSADSSGGGILNARTLTISNSTISSNRALFGGGIFNDGTATVTNSTLSGNSATGSGGGIYTNTGTANVTNSILANSTNGGDCVNGGGTFNASYSLIMDSANACGVTNGTNGNIVGLDPLLGALGNNGGPTQTMALLSGSPAIDTGDDTVCTASPVNNVDQRGVARPQGTHCDIGAYEFDPPPTVTLEQASGQADPTTTSPINFTATFSKAIDPVTFTASDLSLGGTAPGTLSAVITTSNNIVFNIAVSGMTGSGTVTASLPAGQVADLAGTTNTASTSLDNVVTYGTPPTASLPQTGFAPNRLTSLPLQTTPYTSLGSVWLEIPSLNVSTNIVGVPHSASGWNVDWLGNEAGWLNGTAFPSWQGNSVITGHVYNASGLPGPFVDLKYLKYGDRIIVHLYGEQYIFQVTATGLFAPHSTAYALGHLEGHPYLTLITCQQYNPTTDSYTFRRVVRAVLVSVQGQ